MVGPRTGMTINMCNILRMLSHLKSWTNFKQQSHCAIGAEEFCCFGFFFLRWRVILKTANCNAKLCVFSNKCALLRCSILNPKMLMLWLVYSCWTVLLFCLPLPMACGKGKIKTPQFLWNQKTVFTYSSQRSYKDSVMSSPLFRESNYQWC